MLVTELVNVRYLTGFGGTNGACVCGADTRLFFTDFRYTERAEAEVEGWEVVTVDRRLAGRDRRAPHRRQSASRTTTSRSAPQERLEEKLPDGVELVPAGGAVEKLRRVKDASELAAIAAAAELADEVWRWSARAGARRPQRARGRARPPKRGSASWAASPPSRRSSPPGPNGALPHAEPGEREIGARRAGRLRHGGEARRLLLGRHPHLRHRRARTTRRREVYELVLEAQAAALDAVRPGRRGRAVDARRPRADRRGRPRRALRPRARPRRRARGARGAAASRSAPRTCSRRAKW